MASGIELALAIVPAVDMCLKNGKKLIALYRSLKDSLRDVDGKVLRIESVLYKTSVELKVTQRIVTLIDEEYARLQYRQLTKLSSELQAAVSAIESVVKTDKEGGASINSFKYVFIRENIEKAVREVEQWQRSYDPTWYLTVLISDTLVDGEMLKYGGRTAPVKQLSIASQLRSLLSGNDTAHQHIHLDPSEFSPTAAQGLRYTTVKMFSRLCEGRKQDFLMDTLECDRYEDIAMAKADSEALAKFLKASDPETFGLLRCKGLVKTRDQASQRLRSIHFFFRTPWESPRSLRQELLESKAVSLSRRLNIARCLAKSVSFIHVCNFVHKNIRPETIITLSGAETTPSSSAFLLGFDGFRNVNYRTMRNGDTALLRNLYRHPNRQGKLVQDCYVMQHDIYSLGVCLLEIGLWTSFFHYSDETVPLPSEGLGLENDEYDYVDWPLETRNGIKEHLINLAREKLPSCLGDSFTAVVMTCLTCIDADNSDFGAGADMRDEDGILVGVRFIEKILDRLNSISM